MNGFSKLITADKIIKWGLIFSSILLVVEIAYIGIFYFSLPPYLPVFNQMPWGEARLGIRAAIFIPVLISITFMILNFFLLIRLYERAPLLSRILSITTLLTTMLSFIFIMRTIYLLI